MLVIFVTHFESTYLGRFECFTAHALRLLRLSLLCDHSVVAGSSWDDHGCIGVSTLDTLVEHDVLGIVLSTITETKINDVTENKHGVQNR